MSVDELLATYAPAYSDNWEDWLERCRQDLATSPRMRDLRRELLASPHGLFREAILLREEEVEVNEVGEREVYPAHVANGMHRTALYKLLGYPLARVTREATPATGPLLIVELSPSPAHLLLREEALWAYEEALMEHLSWAHQGAGGTVWLECAGGGGNSGVLDEMWLAHSDKHIGRVKGREVLAAVNQRLAPLGCQATAYRWSLAAGDGEDFIDFLDEEDVP